MSDNNVADSDSCGDGMWVATTPNCTEEEVSEINSGGSLMDVHDPFDEEISPTQSHSQLSESVPPSAPVAYVSPLQTATAPRVATPVPLERYEVNVQFPKQLYAGEVPGDGGRKVKPLMDYLSVIIRRAESLDNQDFGTKLSDQVKAVILQVITGYMNPEDFAGVLEEMFHLQAHDRPFIKFLNSSFPRLTRCLLNGDVAIDSYMPTQGLYGQEFFDVPFDGHFLFKIHRSYYAGLVQLGKAPPIPPHIAVRLVTYDEFGSDSESTSASLSEMEEVIAVEPGIHPESARYQHIPARASDAVCDMTMEVARARITDSENSGDEGC